jgi:CRP/FNR family cyclic AMP-dependent transcriptional regulator
MINTDTRNIKFQILRKSDLFDDLTDDELLELASMAVLCAFTKGSTIFREGDQPEYIFIVGEGRIKFFSNSLSGRTIGAGVSEDIIGIHNLLTNEPRWLCTEALDDVIGLKLSRQDFLSYLKNKPMIQLKFLMRADKVLQLTYNRLKVLVDCSADQRVIDILYGLHEKFGSLLPFRIEEIASLAGLTRETTTRITRCLVKSGIIESGRKGVRVVDIDRLKVLKQYSPII